MEQVRRLIQEAVVGVLAAEHDVRFNGQVRADREFLVDHHDAAFACRVRPGRAVGGAVEFHRPGVGLFRAAEHLHQGGLPGPVLSHDCVNFARLKFQVNAAQRRRRAVAFANPRHAKTRRHGDDPSPASGEKRRGVFTSPLEGEVAASLWTRRVGGEPSGDAKALTPHPARKASPPSPSRGEAKDGGGKGVGGLGLFMACSARASCRGDSAHPCRTAPA